MPATETETNERLMTWREWVEFDRANCAIFATRLRSIAGLHKPPLVDGEQRWLGECGECHKPWPCPTWNAAHEDAA